MSGDNLKRIKPTSMVIDCDACPVVVEKDGEEMPLQRIRGETGKQMIGCAHLERKGGNPNAVKKCLEQVRNRFQGAITIVKY